MKTALLATSWHSNKFLNSIRDGAVLPILHLNGYKINNPTILSRISHDELENLFNLETSHACHNHDLESHYSSIARNVMFT